MNFNYDKIIKLCSSLLYESPLASSARSYLNKRLSTAIQEKFNFGFFPDQQNLSMLNDFLTKEELSLSGLLENNKISDSTGEQIYYSPLQQHNLIMPYKDVYGKIIAIVGRSLLNDEERAKIRISKYKNTSFKKSQHVFGLFEAKKSIIAKDCVYLVEGQFDCIKAHEYGIMNVVALGTSNMTIDQLTLLLRYTNKIKLLLDNDDAGNIGRERILEKYGKYTKFSNCHIPQGFKDLDEFLSDVTMSAEEFDRYYSK